MLHCHAAAFNRRERRSGSAFINAASDYTNGRFWLGSECYTKFWEHPEFLSSRFSDIT